MPGPYQSVITSIIISLLFLSGLFIYSVILKRKINLFFLMILISLIPLASMLRFGTYESGDFNIHVYRSIAFYDAISDGQWIPSWPENLNGTYGYPLFLFLNNVPYYIISLLHFIGFGYITSLKLYLGLAFITSGISMWFFAKNHFKKEISVFATSIFYLFAPYHFVDLHFRAAVGEIIAFSLLPLLFIGADRLKKQTNLYNTVLLALLFGILIMSHHAIGVLSLLILTPYLLYKSTKRLLLFSFLSLFLGFIFSIAVWMPHIILREFTFASRLQSVPVSFPSFVELIYSPWKNGLLFQGQNGELSFMIGYTQILVAIGAGFLIIKQRKKRKKTQTVLWFSLFIFILFLMTPFSSFLWEAVPLIKSVQFSTRLLVLMAFITSLLAGFFVDSLKNKWIIYILIGCTISYTILNWGHRRVIPEITDETLQKNVWKSTSEGEGFYGMGTTKWVDPRNPWIDTLPDSHIEVIQGKAVITQESRTSVMHKYKVTAITPTVLKENTIYFPGWNVNVNNKPHKIENFNPKYPGVITIKLPPGSHKIDLTYSDITIIKLIRGISVFTGVYFLFVLLLTKPTTKKH